MKTFIAAFLVIAYIGIYARLYNLQQSIDSAVASIPHMVERSVKAHKAKQLADIAWYRKGDFYYWEPVSEAGKDYCKHFIARPDGQIVMLEDLHKDMLRKCPLKVSER